MTHPAPARLLPREHGTWAMLLVPWAVGWGVAGAASLGPLLLLVAAVALFLAHGQLLTWYRLRQGRRCDPREVGRARRLTVLLAAAGIAAAIPVLLAGPLARLLGIGALAAAATAGSLLLVPRRLDHALPGQLLAAVALSLAAPTAYYVAGGRRDGMATALYLLDAAFFLWAVFYVRLKIDARARRVPRASLGARLAFAGGTLLTDGLLVLVVLAALRVGSLSPLTLLTFGAAVLQTAAGIMTLDRPVPLKRVGILLTAHSILFGAALICLV